MAAAAMPRAAPLPLPGGRPIYEVRFHGRGGQGTVVASVLLAQAAFTEGRGVQAFPFFGVERRGAPVVAHARIGLGPVRLASGVAAPAAVIVMDPSLVEGLGDRILAGVPPGGLVLVNSRRAPGKLRINPAGVALRTVDATAIARRHGLGSTANPIVNTAILGAFVRLTGIVELRSLEEAIAGQVPAKVEENVAAARESYHAMGGVTGANAVAGPAGR